MFSQVTPIRSSILFPQHGSTSAFAIDATRLLPYECFRIQLNRITNGLETLAPELFYTIRLDDVMDDVFGLSLSVRETVEEIASQISETLLWV